MAILKERLKRRNESGGYDTIYLETNSSVVLMSDGTSLETKFNEISNEIKNISSGPALSDTAPLINGTASAGTATTASRSDHVHPTDTTRAASSHNHAASDITSDTLVISRGGTGLTASPSMLTNLASTTAANILVASPRPGVTGTLPLANGGTGKTTSPLALYALINGSTALASTGLADGDYIPIGDVSASTGKKVTLANLKAYLKTSGALVFDDDVASVEIGSIISWAGYNWLVVHRNTSNNTITCCLNKVTTSTKSNIKLSTLQSFIETLPQSSLTRAVSKSVKYYHGTYDDDGNEDYTTYNSKVWFASYSEIYNNTFSYFTTLNNRIATTETGITNASWHLADSAYVTGTGALQSNTGAGSYYIRPFVTLSAS